MRACADLAVRWLSSCDELPVLGLPTDTLVVILEAFWLLRWLLSELMLPESSLKVVTDIAINERVALNTSSAEWAPS